MFNGLSSTTEQNSTPSTLQPTLPPVCLELSWFLFLFNKHNMFSLMESYYNLSSFLMVPWAPAAFFGLLVCFLPAGNCPPPWPTRPTPIHLPQVSSNTYSYLRLGCAPCGIPQRSVHNSTHHILFTIICSCLPLLVLWVLWSNMLDFIQLFFSSTSSTESCTWFSEKWKFWHSLIKV